MTPTEVTDFTLAQICFDESEYANLPYRCEELIIAYASSFRRSDGKVCIQVANYRVEEILAAAQGEQAMTKATQPIAKLVPVRIEVAAPRRGRPGYRWADGFKVVTPAGHELQPWMTKREARKFCKDRRWRPVVTCR